MATAALRVIIASAVLLPLMLLRGHRADFVLHWKKVLLVGVINSAIPFVCIAFALQSISIGQSSVLNATVPLFGALIAWFWLGERPSGSRVVGLLIGFAGIALLASENASFDANPLGGSSAWGIAASLLACLCYGIAASYTRRFLGGVPSLVSATGSQLGASIFLLPFCLWFWPAQAPSTQAWLAVSALGVPLFKLPSGAGHDAMKLHEVMPQAMLFVRGENGGISHNPRESTTSDDMQLCVDAFTHVLNQLTTELS